MKKSVVKIVTAFLCASIVLGVVLVPPAQAALSEYGYVIVQPLGETDKECD